MHPAFSVIFLTTLIGAGQGLFMALVTGQVYSIAHLLEAQDGPTFYAFGSGLSVVLLGLGLFASFFHLGHPERAWRAATRWRTSWLSREVIILPIFMFFAALYGFIHYMEWTQPLIVVADTLVIDASLIVGVLGVVAAVILFVCTAMIYASVKFIQEWHSPLTVANFMFLGLASGFTLAAAFSAWIGTELVGFFGTWAVIFTIIAFATRAFSLRRNANIKHKSSLRTAIGIRHPVIRQRSQGFMGGSFNTREFFHGASDTTLKTIKLFFLLTVFALPVFLLAGSYSSESAYVGILAFVVQYFGLVAERWYFFAEAKHPQNLYYQSMA